MRRTPPRQARRWLATNDARWLRLRAVVLNEEPICRVCIGESAAQPQPSTIVDHIDGQAATQHDYRRDNLQGICETHHNVKTALENGSFGRRPGQAKQQGCDANGTPLDRTHPWQTNKS